ncbi:MAG: hypothetical protein EXR64_04285 [Dehalococcoidia bacterium]|nr:hypothetical protein [Dehalococcoidia bacterium]
MARMRTGATADPASDAWRFLRHYLEMVLAMAAGMPVFGVLFMSPLDPFGYRAVLGAYPYVRELVMLVTMSLPMVGFMVYRGHSLRRTMEMLAGMALPAVAVIGLTATAWVPFLTAGTLFVFSHVAMLAGMFAAMLYRRAEYGQGHHPHAHPAPEA